MLKSKYKILKRVNSKSSHHKKKFFSFLLLSFLFIVSMWEDGCYSTYCGNTHFTIYVNQTIMQYALNLHNDVYQLFSIKREKNVKRQVIISGVITKRIMTSSLVDKLMEGEGNFLS